mmetsp:Transcript_8080/g.33811  ORF Transcript_8080/g.33811 Transcript_8080/m.33811 type:complete len:213 (-) Transcript_8080:2776-3414(-)
MDAFESPSADARTPFENVVSEETPSSRDTRFGETGRNANGSSASLLSSSRRLSPASRLAARWLPASAWVRARRARSACASSERVLSKTSAADACPASTQSADNDTKSASGTEALSPDHARSSATAPARDAGASSLRDESFSFSFSFATPSPSRSERDSFFVSATAAKDSASAILVAAPGNGDASVGETRRIFAKRTATRGHTPLKVRLVPTD